MLEDMKRKTNRNGEVRVVLEKRDIQIGNFVFTDEDDFVRVQSIGGEIMYRISIASLGGAMRKELMSLCRGDEKAKTILAGWNATCMNVLAAFLVHKPDTDGFHCLDVINKAVERAIGLNANLYGIKLNISDAEDNEILSEEKSDHEEMQHDA